MSAAVQAAAAALYALENQGRSACPFSELPQGEIDDRYEMARTAIEAASQHIFAAKVDEVRANNEHIIAGGDGYSSGFHYALHCVGEA